MGKRKTQNIRVHPLQRWSAKLAGAKLDCTIGELVNRVAGGDEVAWRTWVSADKEARKRDKEVGR